MLSTTNTVIKNIIILLQMFNVALAIDYIIITTSSLEEPANKIANIYLNPTAP